jgi:hypothetical protein
MSQSILIKNQENYFNEFQNKLLEYSNTYYINSHFLVGNKINRDKLNHIIIFNRLLGSTSCTMIDFIKIKIAENFKSCNVNFNEYGSGIDDYLTYYTNNVKDCPKADIINNSCSWGTIEW